MAVPSKVMEDPALKDMAELGYYGAKEKLDRAYEGKAVTEMYYPKGLDPEASFYDRGILNKLVVVAPTDDSSVNCAICSVALVPFPRHFKDESLYCDTCLKERWFYTGPRHDADLYSADVSWAECPVEVLARVAGFLTEYRDFAAFSRVSRKCFDGCNGDSWYESEMTKIKRYTISKELEILRMKHKALTDRYNVNPKAPGAKEPVQFWDTAAGEFSRRLEVGNYMGEIMEPATTPERKRRLIGLLVGSQYVAKMLGKPIKGYRTSLLPPRYSIQYVDDSAKGTLTISSATRGDGHDGPVEISLTPAKDRYVAVFENSDEFKGKLFFDAETGLFMPDETQQQGDSVKCKGRKCIVA